MENKYSTKPECRRITIKESTSLVAISYHFTGEMARRNRNFYGNSIFSCSPRFWNSVYLHIRYVSAVECSDFLQEISVGISSENVMLFKKFQTYFTWRRPVSRTAETSEMWQ